jgi:formylglycine-generating enzyme required for sulfatase activity
MARLAGAASLLALIVAPIPLADAAGVGMQASASGSLKKQVRVLKSQVRRLGRRVERLEQRPGPQGPAGPPGAGAVCEGNGSGDSMVRAGAVCIDRYEVSVWSSPTGGTQYGVSRDDYPCNDNGQGCTDIYARSVPGVSPSRFITYFQAQQALANSGKRLPSNGEWQQAVAGTPDPGNNPLAEDCNTNSVGPVPTGSRGDCVSDAGVNDMVGNLWEWVADWGPVATNSAGWGTFSSDYMFAFSGASTVEQGPGVLQRGGGYADGDGAGPFSILGFHLPSFWSGSVGFRGAR